MNMSFDVEKAKRRQKQLKKLMKQTDCTPEEFNQYNAEYYSLEEGKSAVVYMKRVEEALKHYKFGCMFTGYKKDSDLPKIFQKCKKYDEIEDIITRK